MSLSTVMKPHMKNSVVTIVNAREFVDRPATIADLSDVGDIRFLLPNFPQRCDPGGRISLAFPPGLPSHNAGQCSRATGRRRFYSLPARRPSVTLSARILTRIK